MSAWNFNHCVCFIVARKSDFVENLTNDEIMQYMHNRCHRNVLISEFLIYYIYVVVSVNITL